MKPLIKDPWRTGKPPADAPVRKPARRATVTDEDETVVGTANSDHPLDQDLKPDRRFLLRAPGQDYALLINGARDAIEASHIILRAAHNPSLKLILNDAGFQLAPCAQAKPSGFTLTDEEWVLWDPQAETIASGFRRLVQVLLRACREERGFRDRLAQLGLTPVMP